MPQLTCRKGAQEVHFHISADTQTIRSLRDAVRQSFGLDGGVLRLILRGRELLEPQSTLSAAGVANRDVIMIGWAPEGISPVRRGMSMNDVNRVGAGALRGK